MLQVCTDKLECFCNLLFSGRDCSSPANKTKVPLTPAEGFPEASNAEEDSQSYYNISAFNKTNGGLNYHSMDCIH